MKPSAALSLGMAAGLSSLVAGCGEPPPQRPALSEAVIDTLTATCALPAGAISLKGTEVIVAGNGAMTYDQEACILKHVRERLPQAQIRFGSNEDEAAKGTEQ